MADDHRPKISAGCENDDAHGYAKRASDQNAQRILVGMRRSEKDALHDASGDPSAAARAKKHCQPLEEKSSKREFLIKARSDKCIENSEHRECQISLHILELAEVAAKPSLFGKINRRENNCSQSDGDHERPHPTRRPLQADVAQGLAAQLD